MPDHAEPEPAFELEPAPFDLELDERFVVMISPPMRDPDVARIIHEPRFLVTPLPIGADRYSNW